MNMRSFSGGAAKKIALVGIAAATIECAKLALAFLPNVEVVTLLCALYGYVFGWLGVLAALVFVCIEPLIWGVNTWVVLYFIYWPLVAFAFMLLGKAKVKNRWIITLTAVVLTVLFGLLSSFIDVGLFSGYFDNFFYRFSVYYLRGLPFYLAQIATNAVVFPLLFIFISQKLQKLSAAFR
jgi:hypothetical protein